MSYDLNLCKSDLAGVGGIIFCGIYYTFCMETPPVSLSNWQG
jgi:hypothetical protein